MFLLGFGIILVLLMFTLVLKQVLYKASGELSMIVVLAMVLGDGIITGLWYYGLTDIFPNEQSIKYGIGLNLNCNELDTCCNSLLYYHYRSGKNARRHRLNTKIWGKYYYFAGF